MTDIFSNPVLSYKNFNMGREIDVAGTFIFNGIKELEQMNTFYHEAEVFTFLYNIAIGIERLQKVVIVLLEEVNINQSDEFEASLKTHSHGDLQHRIKSHSNSTVELNSRENSFLQLLGNFYKTSRYNRFNVTRNFNQENKLIENFIKKYDYVDYSTDIFTESLINSDEIKEFLGRVIGSISKKYYQEIHRLSSERRIFTYELRHGSKAEKIFLSNFRKHSLQQQNLKEKIAFKELIIYLINAKKKDSFLKYIKEIEALDFDIALANQYLSEISKGNISQDLVDMVETLYEERSYSIDRMKKVDAIGDEQVCFEYIIIHKCNEMFKSLLAGKYSPKDFAENLPTEIEYLPDREGISSLKEIIYICNNFLKEQKAGRETAEGFIRSIKEIYKEYKSYYHLD